VTEAAATLGLNPRRTPDHNPVANPGNHVHQPAKRLSSSMETMKHIEAGQRRINGKRNMKHSNQQEVETTAQPNQ